MTHIWSKTQIPRTDSTQLDYYSPYLSKIQVLNSTLSRILGHYSAYYSTPNNDQISNIFGIARQGRVICRSLVYSHQTLKGSNLLLIFAKKVAKISLNLPYIRACCCCKVLFLMLFFKVRKTDFQPTPAVFSRP